MAEYQKLDLRHNAELALRYLTSMTDPKLDNLPYWLVGINQDPAVARHCRVDDAELVASWGEALVLLRRMLGTDRGRAHEESYRKLVLRDFRDDGLRYHHDYPWTQTIFCNIHEMAYVLGYLATVYSDTGGADRPVEAAARKLVRALRGLAVKREGITFWGGDYDQPRLSYFWPHDSVYEGTRWRPELWTGRGEEVIRNGMLIHSAVRWGEVSGDEAAMDLAEGLLNHLIHESRRFDTDQGYIGHVHSVVWIASGAVRFGRLTGQEQYVDWGRGVYEFTLKNSASFGWVPEYIGWHDPADEHCETCCIKDMIQCSLELIDAGYTQYYDVVDRFVRNQLVENQIEDGGFVRTDNSREDTEECTWRDLDKRVVGGFSGGAEPNSISVTRFRSVAGCCAGMAPQALAMVWERSVRTRKDGATEVNFLLDPGRPAVADVWTAYPHEGHVRVTPKREGDLLLRLPAYAGSDVQVEVGGKPQPPCWRGGCLLVPGAGAGVTVEVRHSFPRRTRREMVIGREFKVAWRGNTVVALHPEGDPLKLYQRTVAEKQKPGRKGKVSQITPRATN